MEFVFNWLICLHKKKTAAIYNQRRALEYIHLRQLNKVSQKDWVHISLFEFLNCTGTLLANQQLIPIQGLVNIWM